MNKFENLGLEQPILQAVEDLGFKKPSEVQAKCIPVLLESETDLVALAQTGTGKTAAFGFPLIQKIAEESRTTQAVILSPTRELCLQITNELQAYSKYVPGLNIVAVYGGASINEQAKQLKKGAQIVVATPGRIKDMIGRGLVNISRVDYCILDEADEMLNMGFYEDIRDILSGTPEEKSTWLFSATMPNSVAQIAKKFMQNPVEITVGERNVGAQTVMHEYYTVSGRDRYPALKRLADANPDIFSVVFCRTKRDTQRVAEKLIEDGYNAGALHGDLSQNQRDLVMGAFRKNQIQMLVATDVAARGIDVEDITHVINYQLPDEIETYTHRSGRTGRAGKSGVSMVILTRSELRRISAIEKKIGQKFVAKKLPTGMEICEIQLYHLASKIKNTEIDEAINPYLPAIYDVLEGLDRETLVKKMVAVEFSRFHAYYSKSKDLNTTEVTPNGDKGSTRYFINIGERDGYDWKSLKDFLKEALDLERDDIYKVDVKDSFSFFNTDDSIKDVVTGVLRNYKSGGRTINAEIATNAESSGRRKKRSKGGKTKSDSRKKQGAAARSKKGKGHRGKRRSGYF
ncbi:DEAD/DEAH box helicase [Lentiprolixibacter aurantiacus]|uniref:RNA helicase n=1 Tax=Lentiprolixibacter aurantiacus TaxID=2993939 RepID=A0AAE3MNM5_9FLAO|nr:DEAD/DEAH box helicase [Lentiprolixibacter aurantiacus]MCX2720204.1 DEAD/DEAH box helicase [Lentiprolixibacter aurantiacus]